ncbi:hypothetical protein [Nocardia cyriacigeorgica]|uniref:hypothetical protein n=1 Tax=Nocardia cyriacigeorgica TaxID=135487 RepID=UPI00056899D1|nr:hypothetical protein [Nocardia cyriacigeorgica]AVH25481.1 hypothetical protein C5B73_21410 [Nocardia cyriacigeorgica]MBF6323207.1 hypothetical protein [Nocardia cyriacigeorgica]MBF6496711.1 hypothetical protein [Nocardia cyriacigeorgica]PPJ15219.1 hypothetical protein C5E43_06700 [Nocardia cyriacigeorgica]TLF55722.1 hypothetical protein FEK31_19165 [Nocardia cyriacigeorgica]
MALSSSGLAMANGMFNVVGGGWPLLHRRSFEAVFGHKEDEWLQSTVAGLLVANGTVQLLATGRPGGVRSAADIGIATAATLLLIDLVYVPKGRIPKSYLLDAAMEVGWLAAWWRYRHDHRAQ